MTTRNLTLQEERELAAQQAAEQRERLERSAPGFPTPGSVWHCLRTGSMFAGRVLSRGDTFSPTAEQIAATFDRVGHSPLSQWGTPDASIQPGEFPADEPVLVHGSVEWQEARLAASERARRAEDPDKAYAEVRAKYGAPPSTTVWIDLPDQTASKSKWRD